MQPHELAVVLAALSLLYAVYRVLTRPSVADIPGPEPTSFWLGAQPPAIFFSSLASAMLTFRHRLRARRAPPRALPGAVWRDGLQVAAAVWQRRARQGAVRSTHPLARRAAARLTETGYVRAGGHALDLGPKGAPVHLPDVGVQLPEAAGTPHSLPADWGHGLNVGRRCAALLHELHGNVTRGA